MLKVGVVGCGAIGKEICRALDEGRIEARLQAVCDVDEGAAQRLAQSLSTRPRIASLDELLSMVDILVEAANAKALKEILFKAMGAGKDILVMSVGGLLDLPDVFEKARKAGCRIHIPSGAIAGLDGVRSAKVGQIRSARLTTRKPPRGLAGAPYVLGHAIDLESIKEERILFEGPAREAVKGFPANVNVAAALSLAGIGPDETVVRIIADPKSELNVHEIEVQGEFGRLFTRTENVPSPTNPKTSYLACLSAIATLKGIAEL